MAAKQELPEMVVLDIGLPGINGYRSGRTPSTASGTRPGVFGRLDRLLPKRKTVEVSHQAGFHHHLVKPVDPIELRKLWLRPAATLHPDPCPPVSRQERKLGICWYQFDGLKTWYCGNIGVALKKAGANGVVIIF